MNTEVLIKLTSEEIKMLIERKKFWLRVLKVLFLI